MDNHSIPDQLNSPKFSKRNDFVFFGNFLHPPNADAVLFLKTKIWPHIHKKLPQASLHIYGAYPKPKHLNLQSKRNNFFVHGHVDDIDYVLSSSKVLLAPFNLALVSKGRLLMPYEMELLVFCPQLQQRVFLEQIHLTALLLMMNVFLLNNLLNFIRTKLFGKPVIIMALKYLKNVSVVLNSILAYYSKYEIYNRI